MSSIPPHEIFSKAQEKEIKFEWAEAADLYESAIPTLIEKGKHLEAGEAQENTAYCRHRAAYQSETRDEFRARLEATSNAHGRASEFYEALESPEGEARALENRAMERFYRSWLVEDPSDRKTQVGLRIEEFKETLRVCENAEESPRFGKACNDFLEVLGAYSELSFTQTEGAEIIEDALDYGSRCLKALRGGENLREIARCHYLLALFLSDKPVAVIESLERQQELIERGMGHGEKAVDLSVKAGDPYLTALSHGVLSYYMADAQGDLDSAKALARRHLEIGERVGDRLVLARANEYLSYYLDSTAANEEDRDIIREAANEAMLHADEAIASYKVILHPILTPFLPRNQCPHYLATIETDLGLKRKIELRGLEASLADLEYAQESGSLLGEMYLLQLLGGTYLSLAKLERDEREKRNLLSESLRCKMKNIEMSLQGQPFMYWNLGAAYLEMVDINGQFAKIEGDPERQREYLVEALAEIERSSEYFSKFFKVNDSPEIRENHTLALIKYGEVLSQMHLASDEEQYLVRAIRHYTDAIETYKKLNRPSDIAWTLWKVAWAYYQISEYQKAATEFDGASRYYLRAGEKYPNHRDFYVEYGVYMEAWGNIARAMDYHSRDEYFLEKEYFEKAVHLQMSSERWRYLSPNYLAWARLAEAESQSRNEQCEKAIELFQETSELFSNAKKSIEDKIGSIGVLDEASMATELIAASDLRMDYCLARVALEEAKLLDRKGEHTASSRRYGDAAQTFLKIVEAMEIEVERREIRPLHALCLAWERMTRAEAEASPDLYNEASALFEEAVEHSSSEKTRLLTRGHASFCRALCAGIRYEVSREEELHQELVLHIGGATDFYVRAGFESAVEYSRATQRLFEAYQYLDRARGAADPGDQTKYYTIAERLLGVSADAFRRAKHPEKMDEVNRLLESLKQDREIAVSLSEILDTPGISHSTESFRAPAPSYEYPVGLESLENADIQAKIFLADDTITTGEELDLELELYNPGKTSASLVRVEGLIPGDFEVSRVSGIYRYEGEVLDLRGKRIGPLGTVEVSLKARPLSEGEFTLEPRIVFVDDTGERRHSEPEPATVTVSEMGILSWLRGTRKPS